MHATLTVLSGPLAGQTIAVPRGKLLIGREVDCHLRPDSALISRHHCVLLLDDYTLRIRDLGSTNGTFVNNRRIGSCETILLDGDTVSVGELSCRIDLSTEPVEGQPSPPPSPLHGTGVFEGDTVQPVQPITPEIPPAAAAPPMPKLTH